MNGLEEKVLITPVDCRVGAHIGCGDVHISCRILYCSLNGVLVELEEGLDAEEGEKILVKVDAYEGAAAAISDISCRIIRKTDRLMVLKFNIVDYDTLMFLKEQLNQLTESQIMIDREFSYFL